LETLVDKDADRDEDKDEGKECLSIFRPNASDNTFPPNIGDTIKYPQFSEKCATKKNKINA
jgi:hypothetical protein